MLKDIINMFQSAPKKIKIISVVNLVSILMGLAACFFNLSTLIMSIMLATFLATMTYFLLKKEKWALNLLIFWYILQSLFIQTQTTMLGFYFGFQASLGFNTSVFAIKFNVLAIIMVFLLLSARKDIQS